MNYNNQYKHITVMLNSLNLSLIHSQSGSRLFILREPFSVYGSFGSRVFVFTDYICVDQTYNH